MKRVIIGLSILFITPAMAQQSPDECKATVYFLSSNLAAAQQNLTALSTQLQKANEQIKNLTPKEPEKFIPEKGPEKSTPEKH